MNKKFLILSLLVFLFSAGNAMAYYDGPGKGRGRHGMGPDKEMRSPFGRMCFGDRDRMRDELGLSEKQIEKVSRINTRYHEMARKYREKIHPLKGELRRLLLAKEVDFNVVRKKLREISEIEIELKILMIRHRLELEKVLSPEQMKKLKRERRRHGRHGMHRGHDR